MLKAFKYRLNPTKEQKVLINKHIGASRFIYNLALETKQMAYVSNKHNLSCFELHSQLKELKEECEWLKELNSQSLQQSITNLDKAYTSFFKGQNSFPNFKKKSNGGTFNVPQRVKVEHNKKNKPKFINRLLNERNMKKENVEKAFLLYGGNNKQIPPYNVGDKLKQIWRLDDNDNPIKDGREMVEFVGMKGNLMLLKSLNSYAAYSEDTVNLDVVKMSKKAGYKPIIGEILQLHYMYADRYEVIE